ncbi:MAG TPA: DNA repair protein RadA [Bacteroidales bacterium]|nr:DNA repair protein RadA [Bacteroidales bacterium]HOU98592.1 DNA repair protein RadA [Bacteroidales bacterium]
MSSKSKTVFFCNQCGYESPKWLGKCPSCNAWNSFVEQTVNTKSSSNAKHRETKTVKRLNEITADESIRINSKSVELNRVLGGGIVNGSVVLIGGEPGIGKSTLMLQFAMRVKSITSLYVSGEESETQLKLRAQRLGGDGKSCLLLCDTQLENIIAQIQQNKPDIVIIDSIQTIQSEHVESYAGSLSQVRECTAQLINTAKENNIPIFIIGHINKEGALAGPKVLEHMVDTVIVFEGEPGHPYRILRAVKNRFGSTSEIGIFEMRQEGLKEVSNPSDILISEATENLSGSCIAATIEGIRPIMIEVQALSSSTANNFPQRLANGYDLKRLSLMLAVIEKRLNIKMYNRDVFLNIVGGIKVVDPAIDLAVIFSILSSNYDKAIPRTTCFAGEVGLNGEIRPVQKIEQRIAEAEKMGFQKMIISKYGLKGINLNKFKIKILTVGNLKDFNEGIFE